MPPHLVKRKRTPEDDARAASPPSKASKAANPNEIDLDGSSDDEAFGPGAPAPARSWKPSQKSIGPTMPAAPPKNTDEIDLSGSDPDTGLAPAMGPSMPRSESKPSIGPVMPPPSKNTDEIDLSDSDSDAGPAPAARPSVPQPQSKPARVPVGPTMPPKRTYGPSLPNPSENPPPSDSDSDSDSDYGPSLPSTSRLPAKPLPEATGPAPTKRDDWMLAPPAADTTRTQDPTKLKNRTFRSGPGASAPPSSGVPSIWTETPQEKLARLQNAVLGRGEDPSPTPSTSVSKEEEEKRRRVEEYTAQTRGKSLYEEKKEARKAGKLREGKAEEEEDDPSKRPFDREKDMALGGRLGAAQKREFMGKAAGFGDRFSKGSYL